MRLLLDEQLSPILVRKLGDIGVFAEHVARVGLSGAPDHVVFAEALSRSAVVVTANVADFMSIARSAEIHAGLIILRAQRLSRLEQWDWLEPVVKKLVADEIDLTNKVVDVVAAAKFTMRDLPPS